ncbi:hypothetical protein DV737_g2444, partial [Chaetothyriales sp. CBS 132003]
MPVEVRHPSPPHHEPTHGNFRPKGILKNPSFSAPHGPTALVAPSERAASPPLDPAVEKQLTMQNTIQNAGHRRSSSAARRASLSRRQSAVAGVAGGEDANKMRLQWDEAALFLQEQEKGGRMKITEPKTPYQYGTGTPDEEDEGEEEDVAIDPRFVNVDEVDLAHKKASKTTRESDIPGLDIGEPEEELAQDSSVENDRIVRSGSLSRENSKEKHASVSGDFSGQVGMPTREEQEKHRKFEEQRKKHYEMKSIKGLLGHPEHIDEDDDDSAPSGISALPSHDKNGKAIFLHDDVLTSLNPLKGDGSLPDGTIPGFTLSTIAKTTNFPDTSLNSPFVDLHGRKIDLSDQPGVTCRIVDFPSVLPGSVDKVNIMHRTISTDFGVVLEGSILLKLDSREVKEMNVGDVVVQRGTLGGYDPQVHRTYPRPTSAHKGRSSVSVSSVGESSPNESLRIPSPLPDPSSRKQTTLDPSSPKQTASLVDTRAQSTDDGVDAIRRPGASLDFMAWGHENLSDYNLRSSVELQKDLQAPIITCTDWHPSNGFGGSGAAQVSFLQQLLPSPGQVMQMVDYHVDNLLWYHGCFHAPTLQSEVKASCQGPSGLEIRNMDLRWAALLFAVMAGSMTSAPNSVRLGWGFTKAEIPKLSRQWYKACLSCLTLADYMCRHHIYTLEAITVLTLSAHIVGFSSTQTTLLGTALKIAQGLGLHKLEREEDEYSVDPSNLRPAQRTKIIQREVGRRIWTQLCVQDWFAVPFLDMYSIQRLHFSTVLPNNIDEHTLEILAADCPSMASMGTAFFAMGTLTTELHDALLRSDTLFAKYEHVLEYDAKMRALAMHDFPLIFKPNEDLRHGWPQWAPLARRIVRLCYTHKIIMLHRPFLGRSFTDPAFAYSRQTCLDSSKVILREVKQASDEDGLSFWIYQAFMIAAGITLVLDLFHRKDDEPELAEHRRLVDMTITMLGKFENSMIGIRGVRLLSALLMEYARMSANNTLANCRRKEGENGQPAQKRQKFNLPRFVKHFAGNDSFTQSLKSALRGPEPPTKLFDPPSTTNHPVGDGATPSDRTSLPRLEYEKLEELFPPLAGISNSFLFEDLLDFEM